MSDIVVRKIRKEERFEWASLAAKAFAPDYPGWTHENAVSEAFDDMALRDAVVFGAFEGSHLVAGSLIRPSCLSECAYELSWVFALQEYRGLGIGRKVIEAALDAAQHDLDGAIGSIILCCPPHNVPLYEKFGFVKGAPIHDGFCMVKIANSGGIISPLASKYTVRGKWSKA